MSEAEIRNLFALGAVILGILVAGYIIKVERTAAEADKTYFKWLHTHGLTDFNEFLFKEGEK